MRLSLRTLLAFEDNIFDVEQHRRLEQLLPTDKEAEASLQRIRSVVRNPMLGVPGLLDHQEELDPNFVAEYLDHQMPTSVQEKFEAYCLSADKYLAEIASIHHILSNVLGEPARTSRECRLKCYDALGKKNAVQESNALTHSAVTQLKHFRPDTAAQDLPPHLARTPQSFWKRWFSKQHKEPAAQRNAVSKSETEQQKSSLWTFTIIGLCICALLLGWQQVEKKRVLQQLRDATETNTVVAEDSVSEEEPRDTFTDIFSPAAQLPDVAEQAMFTPLREPQPNEQTAYTVEAATPSAPLTADPFAVVTQADPPVDIDEPVTISAKIANSIEPENPSTDPAEPIVAFQPITSSAKIPADVPLRQNPRPPMPATAWQSNELPRSNLRDAPEPASLAASQHSLPSPKPQAIRQTSGTAPRALGRAVPMTQPSVIFSAASLRDPWQLPTLPFDVFGEQYLLTAAPFRGMFELADRFRIEMIGDAKICILPPDVSGIPGIFVDYGLMIIHPLQANQSLRIETEKSQGIVTVPSTDSLLFIDTFANIADPPGKITPPEERKAKRGQILGFVPKNGDRIVWKSNKHPQPLFVESQGSVLLQSDQYGLCEIRNLPNWLGPIPMSQEDRSLAEVCRRCFVEAGGDGEKALTQMVQDESRAVRTLGLRLWGDLGRFDVPLTVMTAKRPEDEAIRMVLGRYFQGVMYRDAETIQRFADAIEAVKEQAATRMSGEQQQ